jgi:hypothetical protein
MLRSHVEFVVRADNKVHIEDIRLGRTVAGGRCAYLYRFLRPITFFVATDGQVKKLRQRKGKIQITDRAIERARRLCR